MKHDFKDLPLHVQFHPASGLEIVKELPAVAGDATYFPRTFYLAKKKIGSARVRIPDNQKTIYGYSFYPLENIVHAEKQGIGTLAWLGLYESLDLERPEDYTIHHSAMYENLGHLETIGIDVSDLRQHKTSQKTFSYPEYIDTIKQYARKKKYLLPGEEIRIR